MKESIIGKKYYSRDNSYCVNITAASNYPYVGRDNYYLAGTQMGHPVRECVISTDPFEGQILASLGTIKTKTLIIVSYDNKVFSVLYDEQGVKKCSSEKQELLQKSEELIQKAKDLKELANKL